MDDGPEAANVTANSHKINNNRAMSPNETATAAVQPSDVMMMEATAKLNLMQRNLAQVAARAAAAAAAAAHSQSRLSFSVDSLLGGGHGRRQKEQSEPKVDFNVFLICIVTFRGSGKSVIITKCYTTG